VHLQAKIGEIILNSTVARATVEAWNRETSEYRLVLRGTLAAKEHEREVTGPLEARGRPEGPGH